MIWKTPADMGPSLCWYVHPLSPTPAIWRQFSVHPPLGPKDPPPPSPLQNRGGRSHRLGSRPIQRNQKHRPSLVPFPILPMDMLGGPTSRPRVVGRPPTNRGKINFRAMTAFCWFPGRGFRADCGGTRSARISNRLMPSLPRAGRWLKSKNPIGWNRDFTETFR